MNLLLFQESDITTDGLITVTGDRAEHLRRVVGVRPEMTLRIGAVNGMRGRGVVRSVGADEVKISREDLSETVPLPLVNLILALPRPQMLKRVLELAPQFGVHTLHLIKTARVEKSFFSSPLLQVEHYVPYLLKGMEQAMVTSLPRVSIVTEIGQFFSDTAVASFAGSRSIVADSSGSLPMQALFGKVRSDEAVSVAIGPEGGWLPSEVAYLEDRGFQSCTLGKRVLRVDMAVCAMLAQLELCRQV